MRTLIYNIGTLAGILPQGKRKLSGEEMGKVECIDNAWLLVDDGIIVDFGPVSDSPLPQADKMIDAEGGYVMPSFCDSHSHVVYAGCRDGEFRDKIAGLSYEEIAARGGGILNSADLLHSTSEDELFRQSIQRVQEVMAKGTGALEIKSGYGLTTEDELKMLIAKGFIIPFPSGVVVLTHWKMQEYPMLVQAGHSVMPFSHTTSNMGI